MAGRPSQHDTPLSRCRKHLGQTQAEFAKMMGVGREYIAKLEAKDDIPDPFMTKLRDRLSPEAYKCLTETNLDYISDELKAMGRNLPPAEPSGFIRVPLDLTIKDRPRSEQDIREVVQLLEDLCKLYKGQSFVRLEVKVTHSINRLHTTTELRDRMVGYLARNHASYIATRSESVTGDGEFMIPRGPGIDHGHYIEHNGIEVSIEGLGRFPKTIDPEVLAREKALIRQQADHDMPDDE